MRPSLELYVAISPLFIGDKLMTVAFETTSMTVEEFMARPDMRDYELIDGNLVERKSMGGRTSYIAGRIFLAVGNFVEEHSLGWPLVGETIYRCFGPAQTGRRFDLSFIRFGRLASERIPDADIRIAPDLAVEIVSPNDLAYEVNDKVSLYLKAGVQLVWIVFPETRTIEVFRPDGSATLIQHDQEISGEPVLPGFKAKVGTFFPPLERVETTGEAVK